MRTLDDLFAYADAEGVDLRVGATEVQVHRPRAGHPGRKAFVSGKRKQNTIKTTTFCDAQGRTLFSGVARPGRMHDQTAVRSEGIAEQFRLRPMVRAEVDEGYRGLANECPNRVSAPPKKVKPDVPLGDQYAWRHFRPKGERRNGAPCSPTTSNFAPRQQRATSSPVPGVPVVGVSSRCRA
ncbi:MULTISPECIES: transposase family protein [unclassified Streptomyces]|uniref:transposase family protein n=1 Tax=unclassified Streptomyces TaxID=2593676 RepID=UPI002ED09BD5|nr:transposase family protein [Streptomyces sp. NBC_01620]WTI91294.1 transposase family protein [Streptomyces sp. NBC_00724]